MQQSSEPDFSSLPTELTRQQQRRARAYYNLGYTVAEIKNFELWGRRLNRTRRPIRARQATYQDRLARGDPPRLARLYAEARSRARRDVDEDVFEGDT